MRKLTAPGKAGAGSQLIEVGVWEPRATWLESGSAPRPSHVRSCLDPTIDLRSDSSQSEADRMLNSEVRMRSSSHWPVNLEF